jgi:hypothetical protein
MLFKYYLKKINNTKSVGATSLLNGGIKIEEMDGLQFAGQQQQQALFQQQQQQQLLKTKSKKKASISSAISKQTKQSQAQQKTKKRQKKKQELFDDDLMQDDDSDNSDDSDDDDYLSDNDRIKTEPYDPNGESFHVGSVGSNFSHGSSYMNSESLFDLMMSSKNRDSYFWQYNTQSKGPKTRKVLTLRNKDPHLHRDFYDPVYQLQSLNARSGAGLNKLRKGDGNDVTPNPEKLYNLGNQIRDFIQKSYQINNTCFAQQQQQLGTTAPSTGATGGGMVLSASIDNFQLSNSLPNEKVNLKREKNKIASRACRLKKKAQHEANKIKLFGLNEEHSKFYFAFLFSKIIKVSFKVLFF